MKVVDFTCPLTGTTFDVTYTGTVLPAAAMIFVCNARADGNQWSGSYYSIGFIDGTNENVAQIQARPGRTTTTTRKYTSSTDCIYWQKWTGASEGAFSFNSWYNSGGSVGVTLNIDDPHVAMKGFIVFFDEDDLDNQYAGLHDDLGTGTTAVDITAPNFEPDLVFFTYIGSDTDGTSKASANLSFGVAHNNVLDTNKMIAFGNRTGETTTKVNGYVAQTRASGFVGNDMGTTLSVADFDSQGFSVTPSASQSNGVLTYLALKFAANADLKIWNCTIPDTGSYAETDPGFEPEFGMLVTAAGVASLNTISTTADVAIGVTAFDDTDLATTQIRSQDGVTSTVEWSFFSTSFELTDPTDGTTSEAVGTFDGFDADGWDFSFTTNPANDILGWGFAYAKGSGASPQTISFSQITETSTLFGFGFPQISAFTQVSEAAQTQYVDPIPGALSIAFLQISDVETANAFNLSVVFSAELGQISESLTANAFTVGIGAVSAEIGQIIELQQANAFTFALQTAVAFGQISESVAADDFVLDLAPLEIAYLRPIEFVETQSIAVVPGGKSIPFDQIIEALAISSFTADQGPATFTIGQIIESATAGTFIAPTADITEELGQIIEALSLNPFTVSVGDLSIEYDQILAPEVANSFTALVGETTIPYGQITEAAAAQTLTVDLPVYEINYAQIEEALSVGTLVVDFGISPEIGQITESLTANSFTPLGGSTVIQFNQIFELSSALEFDADVEGEDTDVVDRDPPINNKYASPNRTAISSARTARPTVIAMSVAENALVDFQPETLQVNGSNQVTAWLNAGVGGSAFDVITDTVQAGFYKDTLNGYAAAYSDSSFGAFMQPTAVQMFNAEATIFAVAKVDNVSAFRTLFDGYNEIRNRVRLNEFAVSCRHSTGPELELATQNDIVVLMFEIQVGAEILRTEDQIEVGQSGDATGEFSTFFSGYNGESRFKGWVSRFLIYNRILNASEQEDTMTVLKSMAGVS